jgi:hypothetical protein
MLRYCFKCGSPFHPTRETAKYCSAKCRQEAYRERHYQPKPCSERLIKQYQTKGSHLTNLTCCECNKTFLANGREMMKMYCSNACKQRAYRGRKAYKAAERAGLVYPIPMGEYVVIEER